MSPRSNRKTNSWSQKHVTSMSCKLEPAIWSHDTGQRIPRFDRCQLIIAWTSNQSKKYTANQGCMALSTYCLEYGRHVGQLHYRRRRHCHVYVPMSNTASHEKKNSWVSFSLIYEYGALPGSPLGRQSSAIKLK